MVTTALVKSSGFFVPAFQGIQGEKRRGLSSRMKDTGYSESMADRGDLVLVIERLRYTRPGTRHG